MMINKFPIYSTMDQAMRIYNLLNPEAKDTDDIPHAYTVGDIFNLLPDSITYNGRRGDLSVSIVDIAYFSVGGGWEHVLVHFEPIPVEGDIYDAFIKMIEWLKENNLLNEKN